MDAGPLGDAKPAEVKMAYNQGMGTTVTTDHGPLVVYVAHLGSVRVNPRAGLSSGQRDAGAQSPGQAVAAEENERVVLLGDLNGALDDRAYAGLTSRMDSCLPRPYVRRARVGMPSPPPPALPGAGTDARARLRTRHGGSPVEIRR